jgi:hypothetical protein
MARYCLLSGGNIVSLGGLVVKGSTLFLRKASFFVVAACLSLASGLGLGAVSTGIYLGKTKAEISKNLEMQGYEVEEFEEEAGLIEVEAAIDGVSYEIHVDPKSGTIVSSEEDD